MTSSSIFSNSNAELPSACPCVNNSADPASDHFLPIWLIISSIFLALNGKKGSASIPRFATICSAIFRIVPTRSGCVLYNFHGSVSARYLLPSRARSIRPAVASRNRYSSNDWAIRDGKILSDSIVASSIDSSFARDGILLSKYFWVSTSALFTKFPRMATSSLLLRAWKSFQVNSLSFVSGRLVSKA